MLFRNKSFLDYSTLSLELNNKFPLTLLILKRKKFLLCRCISIHKYTHVL